MLISRRVAHQPENQFCMESRPRIDHFQVAGVKPNPAGLEKIKNKVRIW